MKISEDVLVEVFSFLGPAYTILDATPVCKKWKKISYHNYLKNADVLKIIRIAKSFHSAHLSNTQQIGPFKPGELTIKKKFIQYDSINAYSFTDICKIFIHLPFALPMILCSEREKENFNFYLLLEEFKNLFANKAQEILYDLSGKQHFFIKVTDVKIAYKSKHPMSRSQKILLHSSQETLNEIIHLNQNNNK